MHVYAAEPDGGAATAATEVTVSAANAAGTVDGPVGEIVVKDDHVSTEYTGWSYATNATGTATPWTITTYAFCVDT